VHRVRRVLFEGRIGPLSHSDGFFATGPSGNWGIRRGLEVKTVYHVK